MRILLADDNRDVLESVKGLLEPTFEIVGTVGDGQSMVEAAKELKPDILVSDISMPILDGIEAANKLKESGCKSKIVFLTVHFDLDFIRACLGTGALGYVVKPRLSTELVLAIREALAGRIFVSAVAQ